MPESGAEEWSEEFGKGGYAEALTESFPFRLMCKMASRENAAISSFRTRLVKDA